MPVPFSKRIRFRGKITRSHRHVFLQGKALLVPSFRQKASRGSFKFETKQNFHYREAIGPDWNKSSFIGFKSDCPHLILRDKKKPRFVLEYHGTRAGIIITNVQRLRTEYGPSGDKLKPYTWLTEKENESSRVFAKQLGMHPTDFIMHEFLHRFRTQILSGKNIVLELTDADADAKENRPKMYAKTMTTYGRIIDHYFVRKPVPPVDKLFVMLALARFELDLNKPRVRDALGLK